METTAVSLKVTIDELFSKNGLSVTRLHRQGYDGANNMQVVLASSCGHKHMVRYLYSVTPTEELNPETSTNGVSLLTSAIVADIYDVALELVQRYPRLATTVDYNGDSALYVLAQRSSALPSGSGHGFWQRWIYSFKPALISSTGKSSSQNEKVVQDLSDEIEPKKKENNSENKQVTSNKDEKPQSTLEVSKTMPVLRYVPCSKRKGGQSPFIGCTSTDLKALNGLTFPVTKLISSTISKPPLKGFVKPSQGPEIEHGSLPTERTEEGFDPNAYKLLAKAGYDYKDPPPLGKLSCETTGENVHGLNRTQQKLKGKGYVVKSFKDGVGYSQPPPVRISSRKANAQYITAQSVDEDCVPVAKTSVFDRISRPTSRVSVFKRL
ncbi:hypothetical protein HHK36_013673 [Tetracentron sinense]|uniref:Uncharacterized protein n=1 Tax=Tetracentron sinense TaxID=13715 RepID=A0A834Z6F8_TETSI|nr:hypothetical protein HHK36_013673 [Tetracentron sinense]